MKAHRLEEHQWEKTMLMLDQSHIQILLKVHLTPTQKNQHRSILSLQTILDHKVCEYYCKRKMILNTCSEVIQRWGQIEYHFYLTDPSIAAVCQLQFCDLYNHKTS